MKNKKVFFHFLTFLFLSLMLCIAYLNYYFLFSPFEKRIGDEYFKVRGEKSGDKDIVIVDIDEKSLQELGQWPWSRDKVAQIIKNLTDYGAGIIGLDIVFAEKDNSSPKLVLKKLGLKDKNAPDYDEILSDAISKSPTIAGYVFVLGNDGIKPGASPKNNLIVIEKNKTKNSYLIKAYRAILNIPVLQKAAYSSGYFNTIPDSDGVVRSIPLFISYEGMPYPALTLEMFRIVMGINRVFINYGENGIESVKLGDVVIPTDRYGRMLINYRGPQKSYRYISAADIYNKKINRSDIEGKVILIGTSAAGLLDLRSTPFDSAYPGVEAHANAIGNMLHQDFISRPSWALGADIVSIILALFIIFLVLLVPNAIFGFIALVILDMLILVSHYYLMIYKGIMLNTIFPFLAVNIFFLIGEIVNYFMESKQKEIIKKKFAAKVSPAVMNELIKNQESDILEVKEEMITIFFSDIRSFTTISEKIGDAKSLIELLNDYMTPMVDIITNHYGTVDKFIGDAIMAYWNAPMQVKNHADEALKASIEQIKKLQEINVKIKAKKGISIDIGIGLNSGISVVGEMGSLGRSDYTCIVDAVNLASRSEGLCKPYGAKIVLTQFTKELLKESGYKIRELDVVRVKGKSEPVTVYECFGDEQSVWVDFERDEDMYLEAIKLYKESNFKEALKIFKSLYKRNEQKLYSLYIQRCKHYLENPPDNFDGVFTFTTK